MKTREKHSGEEEEALVLPDLAAAFVVSDSQRVTVPRHCRNRSTVHFIYSLLNAALVWTALT